MEKKFQLKGRTTSLGYVSVYLDSKYIKFKGFIEKRTYQAAGWYTGAGFKFLVLHKLERTSNSVTYINTNIVQNQSPKIHPCFVQCVVGKFTTILTEMEKE
uniref:Uncharacterized protein n=1 Tax=Megaselia scalaris TaxID=36166 RepID=T1GAB0_MEGSC